jgi:hypothetical protein
MLYEFKFELQDEELAAIQRANNLDLGHIHAD